MDTVDPATPRRGYRLRFSLFALFLLMTAVCLLLAWLARPRQCRVESLFQVASRPSQLVGAPAEFDAEEVRAFRQNQLATFKSPFVVIAAIRDPRVASLPVLVSREDPVQWIIDNLEVNFQGDSEILTVRMRGSEGTGDQLRLIVDAVGSAYLNEVVISEDQRQHIQRDALAKSYQRIASELKAKLQELNEMKAEAGDKDDPGVVLRQIELYALQSIWKQMSLQLEMFDVNLAAPPRVRLIQRAVVSVE